MNELREHSSAWEAALTGLAIPPPSTTWPSMEGLLDREMPVRQARKGRAETSPRRGVGESRRRAIWVLLGLLLLLLIGVCNRCYEHRKGTTSTASTHAGTATTPTRAATDLRSGPPVPPAATSPYLRSGPPVPPAASSAPAPASAAPNTQDSELSLSGAPSPAGQEAAPIGQGAAAANQPSKSDSTTKRPLNPAKKTTTPKKPKPNPDQYGWLVGVGINQFFPIGDDSYSNYNSSGTTGGIRDYLPVPVVRYYFHTYLYVQLETQLDAPQYTKNVPVLADSMANAINRGGLPTVDEISVRKLFYFNLPVSIHYSPIKGLYAGAGIQFSRLTNAVGQSNVEILGYNRLGQVYDSVTTYGKVATLKNTTVFQKFHTEEWRVLVDLNYQWKILTLGVQYNQALTPFISVPVGAGKINQYRNSSLQAYVRVALWRRMKTRHLKGTASAGVPAH